MRRTAPVFREPVSGLWMVFNYEGVKRVLTDHQTFSSMGGPPEWMIFQDPPRHSRLRGLIAQAFTPGSVAALEPRIRELSGTLLDANIDAGVMDLATDLAIPLPMLVIGEMLGLPPEDQASFARWNDVFLRMSYTVPGGAGIETIVAEFAATTVEMHEYLGRLLDERRERPRDDLFTRLLQAELDGERLTQMEILGFFQLLLLAGSETTTNLINNAVISFTENPEADARLRANPELLPLAIEEVLRYRSPLQWMFRIAKSDVPMGEHVIPAGKRVLAMIGSANRDPAVFDEPDRFIIDRNPNPHLAFGHGIHFCLGSSLARLEARIALGDLLSRTAAIRLASEVPWEPKPGLHVHGPASLPIRFDPKKS
jgi:cytochrome P450